MNKTLLAAPIYKGKDYTMRNWLAHIKMIADYSNLDVVLCDNTGDGGKYYEYIKSIIPKEWVIIHRETKDGESSQEIIADSQNILRRYFLNNKQYENFLFIEADIYPPVNFFDQLRIQSDMNNADVISGLYFLGTGKNIKPMIQTVFLLREPDGKIFQGVAYNFTNREAFSYFDLSQNKRLISGKPTKVYATGFGCCLIKRNVLEKISFRSLKEKDAHSDSFFYADCMMNGFSVYLDSNVICRHDNFDWKD